MFDTARKPGLVIAACIVCACSVIPACGQDAAVTMRMAVRSPAAAKQEKSARAAVDASDIVVWLKPLDPMSGSEPEGTANPKKFRLVQHNKSFQPHVLVVPVGSVVDFPNHDPFFHNVFSLFDGKRFDLGLYEAGATNSVKFDRIGVSLLFCNIHPEMSAVVVALNSPYYAVSDRSGNISIAEVPDGNYELHVWYERSLPEELKVLTRAVALSASSRNLGLLSIPEDSGYSLAHKNKFGQDYAPPPAQGYGKP